MSSCALKSHTMYYFTNISNLFKKEDVKRLLNTKIHATANINARTANSFRKTIGLRSFPLFNKTVSLEKTIELLGSGVCSLDDELTREHAKFNQAIIAFEETDKEYKRLTNIQEISITNPK